jgi:hypothetical protein
MQTLDEPQSPPLQYTLMNNPSPITTSLCLDREYSRKMPSPRHSITAGHTRTLKVIAKVR